MKLPLPVLILLILLALGAGSAGFVVAEITRTNYDEALGRLNEGNADLEAQVMQAEQNIDNLETQREDLTRQSEELESTIGTLRTDYTHLLPEFGQLRDNNRWVFCQEPVDEVIDYSSLNGLETYLSEWTDRNIRLSAISSSRVEHINGNTGIYLIEVFFTIRGERGNYITNFMVYMDDLYPHQNMIYWIWGQCILHQQS